MLSVLSVAYPFAPVDRDPVGGAEQVVAMLDNALVAAGCRSTVVAHPASEISGELVAVDLPPGPLDGEARRSGIARWRQAIADRLARGDVDLIHLHGQDFWGALPDTSIPTLVTLHLPLAWYPPQALVPDERIHRICVSRSQRATARRLGLSTADAERLAVVENGVRLDRFRPAPSKNGYVLTLGRICPEKGFDVAVRACRRASCPLLIAGVVFAYDAHQRYFREVLAPLLDDRRRFLGPIVGDAKRDLLARARCVLIPSLVDETSSLVAMEALASGTPVVAFRRGALPDIVEHGRTGFIVEGEHEMADAIDAVGRIRPEDCRAAAEARFSAAGMVRGYFQLYERLMAGRSPATSRPTAPSLELEEIRDDAELAALSTAWSELCDRDRRSTPFQRPEWLLAARRQLAAGRALRALAVRRGAELVGLLVLEQSGGKLTGAGAGVSDYLDVIADPAAVRAVVTLIWSHLMGVRDSWNTLELEGLRPDSPLVGQPPLPGCRDELAAAAPTPIVALPLALPAGRARNLAYCRRKLARAGAVVWRTAGEADTADTMAALFHLHGARWASRGEAGVLADPAVRAFHLDAATALARRGLLRAHALTLNDRVVAVLYGFAAHRRTHYYLSGFDPAAAALSPGVLIIDYAIAHASHEGSAEFDFLRGGEAYKYAWGAVDRRSFSRRMTHD